MHKRQLRQEADAVLEHPPSEAILLDTGNENQGDGNVKNKYSDHGGSAS